MPRKPKIKASEINSREAMSSTVSQIVFHKLAHASLKIQMDQEVLTVQQSYQAQLDLHAQSIESLEAAAYIWCQNNAGEFGDKKSIDFTSGIVGYRTCPAKVASLFDKDSDKAIARRLESLEWGEDYLTFPDPKPNKDALLADRNKLTPAQLRQAGIKFEQGESFYVEPKAESIEASKQAA